VLLLLWSASARAQSLGNYTFSSPAGSYSALSAGVNPTFAGTLDEGYYNSIPLGFTFIYNGVPYTTVSAATNGWLTLGQAISNATYANNLATGAVRPTIAPLWDDLGLTASTDFTYLTTGTAGSRVFTAEWKNVKWDYSAAAGLDFQVHLYESSGKVEFIYKQEAGTVTAGSASIGLAAVATGAGNYRSLNGVGAAPTASSAAETTTLAARPASNQTYVFTPPAAPTAPSGVSFASVTATSFTLNFTDNSATETGFLVERSTDNVSFSIVATLAANTATLAQPGLASGTTYYYRVSALSEGAASAAATGQRATSAGAFCGTAGVATVGPTGTYATLTAALAALATQGICAGGVTLELQAAYTSAGETFPINYTNAGTAANRVTIRPAAGAPGRLITGANATSIFTFSGGDYLTIDGRPGGVNGVASTYLIVRNTNTSGAVIRFQNDAVSNSVVSCVIEGTANAAITGSDILFGNPLATAGATGNDDNAILNNDIRNLSSVADASTNGPSLGIYSVTTLGTATNSGNIIRGNRIFGYAANGLAGAGIRLNATGNGDGWLIGGAGAGQGNQLFLTTARTTTVTGIDLLGGSSHQVIGNSVYQTASLALAAFTGINIASGSGHLVNSNIIGGSAADASGTVLSVTGGAYKMVAGIALAVGSSPATEVQGNVIRNISNTSTATVTGNISYGISLTAGQANIGTSSGNTIGDASAALGLKAKSALIGISIANAAADIRNNTIDNLQTLSGSVAASGTSGINVDNAGTASNVQSNTVRNVSLQLGAGNNSFLSGIEVDGGADHSVLNNTVTGLASGANAVAGNAQTVGIFGLGVGVGALTVAGNTISDVGSSSVTAPSPSTNNVLVVGISFLNAGSGSIARNNRLLNIYSTAPGNASNGPNDGVQAMTMYGSTNGSTYVNNQISLARADALRAQVVGMLDGTTSGAGGNSFYYNTVYLTGGSAGSGSSHGFRRTGATPPTMGQLRNNIFYNGRTGTTGSNYAIGSTVTAGWTTTASDYNLLVVANAATVGEWSTGVPLSFAGWKAAQTGGTGGDASSLSTQPASVPGANLFVDASLSAGIFASGDLSVNTSKAEAWYVNGTGVQVPGISGDFGNAASGRSVAVSTGATDIGADEFTPSATPPALTASGAPTLGGTQTFSLGGRVLASIYYRNVGTLPSTVTARYYPGTNPPPPYEAGARYQNAYLVFSDSGDGSNFQYVPTLMYDPALLGTIPGETAQRVSLQTATGYGTYFTTQVNTTARTLDAYYPLTRFGLMAVSDVAAPLPVELTAFGAERQGSEARLSWTTASEKNSRGFEVQVSSTGREFRVLSLVASETPASASPRSYSFVDREAGKAGTRYYRLRQLDLDGSESFSPVRSLRFGNEALPQLTAAPNPFAQQLTLTVSLPAGTVAAPAMLRVTDAMGRTVLKQLTPALPGGRSQLEVPGLAQLGRGVYFVQLAVAGQPVQHLKVVKE
jgi:hypothetical protein